MGLKLVIWEFFRGEKFLVEFILLDLGRQILAGHILGLMKNDPTSGLSILCQTIAQISFTSFNFFMRTKRTFLGYVLGCWTVRLLAVGYFF